MHFIHHAAVTGQSIELMRQLLAEYEAEHRGVIIRHGVGYLGKNYLIYATEAPDRDLGWRPARQFFQGFPPWNRGLHDDQPTQQEAMTAFPEAGHATKQEGDKHGQIGDRDHSTLRRARV